MKILTNANLWDGGETAVAFGTFDGVHLGHQSLMAEACRLSREHGIASMAYTYSNHPMAVFCPERVPLMLETPEEKIRSIEATGVDAAVLRPFSREYAQQPPRQFMEAICAAIHPRFVIIGFNYTFGDKGSGKAEDMVRIGRELGFETHVMDAVIQDGAPVCSTRIREAVGAGEMEKAAEMLGHPYAISGTTIPGRRIGTAFGFPTANLSMPEGKAIPAYGVYASLAEVDGRVYCAATNVGEHPTVPGRPRIEAHLLDYDGGELYGREMRVQFLHHTRGEFDFGSLEALRDHVNQDKLTVRQYFEKNPVYKRAEK